MVQIIGFNQRTQRYNYKYPYAQPTTG